MLNSLGQKMGKKGEEVKEKKVEKPGALDMSQLCFKILLSSRCNVNER